MHVIHLNGIFILGIEAQFNGLFAFVLRLIVVEVAISVLSLS